MLNVHFGKSWGLNHPSIIYTHLSSAGSAHTGREAQYTLHGLPGYQMADKYRKDNHSHSHLDVQAI